MMEQRRVSLGCWLGWDGARTGGEREAPGGRGRKKEVARAKGHGAAGTPATCSGSSAAAGCILRAITEIQRDKEAIRGSPVAKY